MEANNILSSSEAGHGIVVCYDDSMFAYTWRTMKFSVGNIFRQMSNQ